MGKSRVKNAFARIVCYLLTNIQNKDTNSTSVFYICLTIWQSEIPGKAAAGAELYNSLSLQLWLPLLTGSGRKDKPGADNICCASFLFTLLYTFFFQRLHKFHLLPRYSIQIIICHKILMAQLAWSKSVLCNASVWIITSQMTATAVGTEPAQLVMWASGASITSCYMSSLK